MLVIAEALRRNIDINDIHEITKIDLFFLQKFKNIVDMEETLSKRSIDMLDRELLLKAKNGIYRQCYSDVYGQQQKGHRKKRGEWGIKAAYKTVDKCTAAFKAAAPYYYSTYDTETGVFPDDAKRCLCLDRALSVSGRGLNLTTVLFIRYGVLRKRI